jgi:tRNA nucleotidyltransferase/poly(A) polymerase
MVEVNLKRKLNSKAFDIISECSRVANIYNIKIYLVGGIVRDLLLSYPIHDIDITVVGNVNNFIDKLKKHTKIKKIKLNENLPTAKVLFKNGIEIDFASTRKEIYKNSGELPTIIETGCSLKEDVQRRDFTINTLIISLNKSDFLKLYDFTGGIEDLRKKEIKVLHSKSFYDDPSRIIRVIKFSQRLDFNISDETQKLIFDYLKNPIKNIPLKRIKKELYDIFSTNQTAYFSAIEKLKIYKIWGINDFSHIEPIKLKWGTIDFQVKKEDIWLLYFVVFFSNSEIPEKLNLTVREKNIILDFQKILLEKSSFNDNYSLYKYFKNKDYIVAILYGIFFNLKKAKKFFRIKNIKNETTGYDLQKAGIPQGKVYSDIQQAILKEKLNNKLVGKSEEIKFAKKFYAQLKK